MMHPLDQVRPALRDIGAVFQSRENESNGYEDAIMEYWSWRGRLIRMSFNITDNLGCDLSELGQADPRAAAWVSIFRITVAGFEAFDDERKLNWLMEVPKGSAYPKFLSEHVRRLPSASGTIAEL